MRFVLRYLFAHIKSIVCYALMLSLFVVTSLLFEVPLSPILYTLAIGSFPCALLLVIDCCKVQKAHQKLIRLQNATELTMELLPKPVHLLDADYAALLHTQLIEKRRLTNEQESRYRSMNEYYTIWVHQIKTPIAAMHLQLQDETQFDRVELEAELHRIEQYVEMVLCYIRMDRTVSDLVIKEYDLDAILRQAVRKYSMQFIRKKLRLCYEPVQCSVRTDEKWLLFVIEQVLSNALKYTKTGSITIQVTAPKTLCITDTGIGIAPEDVPRIFERGYTGYNGRQDKRASGIGLYLCSRICQMLHHTITATSTPNVGTTIQIGLDSANLQTE